MAPLKEQTYLIHSKFRQVQRGSGLRKRPSLFGYEEKTPSSCLRDLVLHQSTFGKDIQRDAADPKAQKHPQYTALLGMGGCTMCVA